MSLGLTLLSIQKNEQKPFAPGSSKPGRDLSVDWLVGN
jgi:hypothetical protein